MNTRDILDSLNIKKNHPEFRVGDTVRVHVKIREADKERIQIFEGAVIKKRGSGKSASFTVRKVSYGIGVERIFPLESAILEKIEVAQKGKVRRARLFYLRKRKGKATQIEEMIETPTESTNSSENEGKTESKSSQASATQQDASHAS